jgi:hypothetical protein
MADIAIGDGKTATLADGKSPKVAKPKRLRITKRAIEALRPERSSYRIWDNTLAGFGLYVLPSGVMTYVVKYRPRAASSGGKSSAASAPLPPSRPAILPANSWPLLQRVPTPPLHE